MPVNTVFFASLLEWVTITKKSRETWTQTHSLCLKNTCFHVLMLQNKQKISNKQNYPLKDTKHVDSEEETDNDRQRWSLLMVMSWMLKTAALIVWFRWKRGKEKENRCRRVCLCSGSFHQQTATRWKKNTKEITFSLAAAQTKDTKHKEFALSSGVSVFASRNTQILVETKPN